MGFRRIKWIQRLFEEGMGMRRKTPFIWIVLLLGLVVLFLLLIYPGVLRRNENPSRPAPDSAARQREHEVTYSFPARISRPGGRSTDVKEITRKVKPVTRADRKGGRAEEASAEGYTTALHDELKVLASRRRI